MIKIPQEIEDAITCDRLIFFVGAGFSQNLNIPNWNSLAKKAIEYYAKANSNINLLQKCLDRKVIDEILTFDALKKINKSKISKIIKDNVNIHIDDSQLKEHKKLWQISKKIITTNYDKSLEESKPSSKIEVVTYKVVEEIVSAFKANEWLFHLHGRIDNIDDCIIFSEDYVKLYSKKHRAIEQLKNLAQNTLVFIGFSMKDEYVSKLFNELDILFENKILQNHYIILKEDERLPNEHLNKLPVSSYDEIPELLNKLVEIKNSSNQCKVPVKRYLRRRSRAFKLGTDTFNQMVNHMLQTPVNIEDRESKLNEINKHSSLYERTILKAIYYENVADIEKMIEVLKGESFEHEEELTRKLYLAIGYEKIDYLSDAITVLNQITSYPRNNDIITSAKFNLCICNEKLNDFQNVYFDDFIQSDLYLESTKEKLKEKAINNSLIVCHKRGLKFEFEDDLNTLLNSQSEQSPKSFYKTLINNYNYKNIKIEEKEFNEIFELSKKMTMNSRATLICQLYKTANIETKIKVKSLVKNELEDILANADSKSIRKHIQDFRNEIDG